MDTLELFPIDAVVASSQTEHDPVRFAAVHFNVEVISVANSKVRGGGAVYRTEKDGKRVIWIAKRHTPQSPMWRSNLWHEVGHLIDRARFIIKNGRSNLYNSLVAGDVSQKHRALLQEHADFITADRPYEICLTAGGRGMTPEELDADTTLPPAVRQNLLFKVYQAKAQARAYFRQDIELFAEGFALFMTRRNHVEAQAPKLAEFFREITAQYGLA